VNGELRSEKGVGGLKECHECGGPIPRGSGRRKFCTNKCAHRTSGREYQQRKAMARDLAKAERVNALATSMEQVQRVVSEHQDPVKRAKTLAGAGERRDSSALHRGQWVNGMATAVHAGVSLANPAP